MQISFTYDILCMDTALDILSPGVWEEEKQSIGLMATLQIRESDDVYVPLYKAFQAPQVHS